MSLFGKRASKECTNWRRILLSKSLSSRRSNSSWERPGFKSMFNLAPAGFPVRKLLALSTSGPETPKCVKSISPSSSKTSFPFVLYARSVTLRSESPESVLGQSSSVSNGMRAVLEFDRLFSFGLRYRMAKCAGKTVTISCGTGARVAYSTCRKDERIHAQSVPRV